MQEKKMTIDLNSNESTDVSSFINQDWFTQTAGNTSISISNLFTLMSSFEIQLNLFGNVSLAFLQLLLPILMDGFLLNKSMKQLEIQKITILLVGNSPKHQTYLLSQ